MTPAHRSAMSGGDTAKWDADVLLADGGVAHVRAVRSEDSAAILSLYERTSESSMRLRYFGRFPRSWQKEVDRLLRGSPPDEVTLIALIGDVVVAVASYALVDQGRAEVAFLVDDAHHSRGLASVLLEHLAAVARASGVGTFQAEVMSGNDSMVAVFRQIGLTAQATMSEGIISISVTLETTSRSREVMLARAQSTSANSVARLLRPASVAVVGASREPGTTGHEVLLRLLGGGFNGPVFPVNPAARHVAGVKAYASISEVPEPVDVAFVATRPTVIADVVSECAAYGVHALVVLSGGFADIGERGMVAQRELVAQTRAHGMRLVGPAGMGVINTDPAIRLNGTLINVMPEQGSAAFFAQSGALSIDVLRRALRRGMGVSTFVSAGTRADVSVTDLMHYWISDEATNVVLLYLENFGSPRRFARIARALSRRKPVVALNAVSAGDRRRTDAMYGQAGVIRVDSLAEMLDVAALLANGALPRGNRVAVITNMLSLGEIAEASCSAHQLEVVGGATVLLPIDAPLEEFEETLMRALWDDEVDSVLSVFLRQETDGSINEVIARCMSASDKPVLPVLLGHKSSVPSFDSPEEGIRALAHSVRYSQWLAADAGGVEFLDDVDTQAAQVIVGNGLRRGTGELNEVEARELLASYGVTWRDSPELPDLRLVVEVVNDPIFGRAMSLGLADRVAELLDDRAWRALPMTDLDAVRLTEDVGTTELIHAALDERKIGAGSLHDLVRRIGHLGAGVAEVDRLWLEVGIGSAGLVVTAASAVISELNDDDDDELRRLPVNI